MKPIETKYNGYRFRSRLEARWAVFFDIAGINYDYEPEGYILKDGTKYLPDFYLNDYQMFVEIKPFDRSVVKYVGDNNIWEQKCIKFREATEQPIMLCYGDPATNVFKMLFACEACDSGGGYINCWCNFVEFDGNIVICTQPFRSDREIFTTFDGEWETNDLVGTPYQLSGDMSALWERAFNPFDPSKTDLLNFAKLKARQARFEYGENAKRIL